MSDVVSPEPEDAEPLAVRPARASSIDPEELPALAAVAIVVSVLAVLVGALLLGTGAGSGADRWKLAVKSIGLGSTSSSIGTAPLIGAALILALSLLRAGVVGRRAKLAPLAAVGATAAAGWLVGFTVLNMVVDMTLMDADVTSALGLLVADTGALAVLVIAFAWGYTSALTTRQAS